MIFSLALCFFPFPLIVSSQGEHIEIKSNLVNLLINTFLCSLSKIKVLIIAPNTLYHLHPPLPLWSRTLIYSIQVSLASLFLENVSVLSFRAFLSALPGTFFPTLLSDLFLYLLQVSVWNLIEKPFLTILLFILISVYSICLLSVHSN